jgi:hypothetical protein
VGVIPPTPFSGLILLMSGLLFVCCFSTHI